MEEGRVAQEEKSNCSALPMEATADLTKRCKNRITIQNTSQLG